MRFEIYAVEQNLGTLLTAVRFKVYENVGDLERVKDDCRVTVEGRYEFDDENLLASVETIYRQSMGI